MFEISELSVRGFKSIAESQSIRIAPVTLLIGNNSSGKSIFMQPFLLLKQTIEAPFDPGALLFNGENVKLTNIDQILNDSIKSQKDFTLKISFKDQSNFSVTYEKDPKKQVNILKQSFIDAKDNNILINLNPQMDNNEIEKIIPLYLHDFANFIKERENNIIWKISQERCFLTVEMLSDSLQVKNFGQFAQPVKHSIEFIKNIIHVPAIFSDDNRNFSISSVSDYFPGKFEKYCASLIYKWQNEKKLSNMSQINISLQELMLANKLACKQIDDTRVEIQVSKTKADKKSKSKDLINIFDAGLGVKHILSYLIAMIVSKKGQTVYFEQPELYLHPSTQYLLANQFIKYSKKSSNFLIETHSPFLLKGFQDLYLQKEFSKDQIAIHYFHKDEKTNNTTINEIEIDDKGDFINNFFNIEKR